MTYNPSAQEWDAQLAQASAYAKSKKSPLTEVQLSQYAIDARRFTDNRQEWQEKVWRYIDESALLPVPATPTTVAPLTRQRYTPPPDGGNVRPFALKVAPPQPGKKDPTLYLVRRDSATNTDEIRHIDDATAFYPVAYRVTRTYFPPPDGRGDGKPLCKSSDALVPDVGYGMAAACVAEKTRTDRQGEIHVYHEDACPYAKFTQDVTGRTIRPACTLTWGVICAVDFGGEIVPVEVSYKSTTAKAGRQLVAEMDRVGAENWYRLVYFPHIIDAGDKKFSVVLTPAAGVSPMDAVIHGEYSEQAQAWVDRMIEYGKSPRRSAAVAPVNEEDDIPF